MGWLAEIFRKEHRACSQCRLAPTHLYDPDLGAGRGEDAGPGPEGAAGAPLCTGCLGGRLERDLAAFGGRCLLFEPSLGPEALIFHPFEGAEAREWPAEQISAARASLARIKRACDGCGQPGRYLWVPVESDANLWPPDCLACLADGTLRTAETLCGPCAARRLVRSIEERGLCFEAVVPPRGGDGVLFGCEA